MTRLLHAGAVLGLLIAPVRAPGPPVQQGSPTIAVQVTARLEHSPAARKAAPVEAVLWLTPVAPAGPISVQPGSYKMVQKDKMFLPHLLVVPMGSTISFPNEDPFFHNVFSYYNGRRFDLGLYEAGASRSVRFSREGVSYVFCNIHPEMSAVIITLATPYYATADPQGAFLLPSVPVGDYHFHVWTSLAEGPEDVAPARLVHIAPEHTNLGVVAAPIAAVTTPGHKNKFGQEYPPQSQPAY
jgi:plastocyanin